MIRNITLSLLTPSRSMQAALEVLSRPCSSRYASIILRKALVSSRERSFSSCRLNKQQETHDIPRLSDPVAYVSESTDPWFNLSYEDWLLRNTPHNEPTLFLYRNTPCVVLGRNQNPWKESTPRWLRDERIPLIRRRSGGGTVFHDLGNVNFSIILPRLLFTRNHGAEMVARAVRNRLGIGECTVNERNDVVIRTNGKDLKVSGSAYKIIQNRAYHHGTMLISSDLSNLGKALKSSSPNMETKGIPSYRSPVTTLNSHLSLGQFPINHQAFIDSVLLEFSSTYGQPRDEMKVVRVRAEAVDEPKVWTGVDELKSWEWTYGQTPEFTNVISTDLPFGKVTANISSRKALVTSLAFDLTKASSTTPEAKIQTTLDELAVKLVGKRYEELDIMPEEVADGLRPEQVDQIQDVIKWLRSAM